MNNKWGNVRFVGTWNSNLSVKIIADKIKNANGFTMHLPLNSIAKLMLWCTIGPVCIVSWFWLWFLELIQDKGVFPSWWGLVLFRAIIMFSTCTLILRSPQTKEYIFSEWKKWQLFLLPQTRYISRHHGHARGCAHIYACCLLGRSTLAFFIPQFASWMPITWLKYYHKKAFLFYNIFSAKKYKWTINFCQRHLV